MAVTDGSFFFGAKNREEKICPPGYLIFAGEADPDAGTGKHHPGKPAVNRDKPV
jgi:hypothetical protein